MAERLFLCTCVICLKERSDGVQLTLNTYNRHRKRQQERDISEDVDLQKEREDLEFQIEDIDQWDDLNFIDELDVDDNTSEKDTDNESLNIDEEDKEYYEDDDEDDDDDDDEIDEDTMQIDDKTDDSNNKIIEGLKLLYLKSLYNFTESAYDDIMKIFTTNHMSLYKIKKYLKDETELVPVFYNMCENSCICYTGNYESYENCSTCKSSRFDGKGKARKVMPYLSIKDRLKIQFSDENRAKELLYRHEYITNKDNNKFDDIFDGKIYKKLVNENLFNDKRDVVFTASCDGYQIFKQKTDDCWLFLMINNNLDPSLRVKKENLLVPFLILRPSQPKDFNTFLRPFIDEMKELERKNFFNLSFFIYAK